jgi:aryl-alcohol dehydrogenase-like predicted oxidoreductase
MLFDHSNYGNSAMEYRKLGNSDVEVSLIGLGTMTWGEQNTEREAHEQIDYALDHGVTLIDAAEMYPVPPRPETQGATERCIGTWLAQHRSAREKIVLATKIAGPARQPHNPRHIRGEGNQFDRKNLTEALNDSLKRLQTEYVDLYQLHWPDRSTMTFGRSNYPWVEDTYTVPIEETLSVLAGFVKEGKIRHIGVSNETPWGVAQFLRAAEKLGLPSRRHRSARVLAARFRLALGQVRGRRASRGRPHHAVRTLPALQQAACGAGDQPLCRTREAAWVVARAIRAGVRQ